MVEIIMVKFMIIKNLVQVFSMRLMDQFILEIGYKIIITVKVFTYILMDKDIKVNYNRVKGLVKARYIIQTVIITKEIGKITKRMDMENK